MKSISAPIRIGYCLSLTGPVSGNSRSAQLTHDIWRDQVNIRGGLLGRPVELVRYDDQGDGSRVASLYARLIEDDRVDLVMGGYGTNTNLAALPEITARRRFFVGLMALGANIELQYSDYFAMIPTGPDPNASLTEGFFETASLQNPRPTTVALLSADAVFSRNPILGAKANATKYKFEIVHEATYPLTTTDFAPFLDAAARSECDLLFLCSYLQDSVDLLRSLDRHSFRPKMVGASMIGPQNAGVRSQLGPLLNGIVNYEYWVPAPSLAFEGVDKLLKTYSSRAAGSAVDPLGHYMAPLAYSQMQVIEQAIEGTRSLNDSALSEFTRNTEFSTVMGKIKFGVRGEWAHPRVLQLQFQNVDGSDVEQYRDGSRQVVVAPRELASGQLIYPFENAREAKKSDLRAKSP
ncbi:amino acid ABC transporter substrate-binding protein [Bradyrhizobium sp. CCGB20]|uniref:amino acid ABC transporter substrate-binding protein n=1 Tax=Bradyrhizobium sp. CCGB20 TaxID=2949633 RepID=UPI0020B415A2|nr:amino acid ABC transporter substrate-binding protein [Bradyrhizobium sp. CCGB20]MCP3402146.1 amino acid ABC transporter substrate-binding protein [Bradyrhizobium sp. CCGB20]